MFLSTSSASFTCVCYVIIKGLLYNNVSLDDDDITLYIRIMMMMDDEDLNAEIEKKTFNEITRKEETRRYCL